MFKNIFEIYKSPGFSYKMFVQIKAYKERPLDNNKNRHSAQ